MELVIFILFASIILVSFFEKLTPEEEEKELEEFIELLIFYWDEEEDEDIDINDEDDDFWDLDSNGINDLLE